MLCTSLVLLASPVGAEQTVAVECSDMTLPVIVYWEGSDGAKGEIEGGKGKMPAGKLKVQVKPARTGGYYTPVRFCLNDGELGEITLFPQIFDFKDKDVLNVHCERPIAPWNSSMVDHNGKPVLVGLSRPWAIFEVRKWEAGKGGKEEYANSAFFLAKYGIDEMARRVAHRMVAEKEERTDHVGVLPSVGEVLTEAELRAVVTAGLNALLGKCPLEGPSIAEEIAEAKALLAKGRGSKPK